MTCKRRSSPIIEEMQIDGEIERFCLAASHPYLTPGEETARDAYLSRIHRDDRLRKRHPSIMGMTI